MAVKKVKYVGPHEAVEIQNEAGDWVTVKRLAQIEVPTRQANEMAEQEDNWALVEAPKDDPKPTPAKADTKDGE